MDGTDVQKTPGWVKDLERKRLRPHKLAHEIGAGASCLTCGDACPGLDLHFWRKSCRNCKCSREKHDVKDEQGYEQFEILLGAGHKTTLKKTYQLHIEDCVAEGQKGPVSFDWVPPGISPDVAERYMQELPASQRPISGSEGAQRRREQLERQVPPHDVDPNRCHLLSDAEVSGLENYRQQLKEAAVGQGRVATLAAMLKELRLPYAITPDKAYSTPSGNPARKLEPLSMNNNNDDSFPPPPSPETLSSLQPQDYPSPPPPPLPESLPPWLQRPKAFLPKPYHAPSDDTSTFDPSIHQHIPDVPIYKDINLQRPNAFLPKPLQPNSNETSPNQNTSQSIGESANSSLDFPPPPPLSFDDAVKTPGLEINPITNQPIRAARYDNNNAEGELPGQLAGLQLTVPEGGSACMQCSLPAAPGDVVVTADRAGPGTFWHPACFVCSTCKELLVDLIYFHKDNKLFCGRHFAEEVNIPRCHACDELIFTTEYTLAEEQYYHVRHFCCIECDIPLAGMKYISRDNHPYCLDCYQKNFSKTCNTCKKLIGASESSVIWQELHWHAASECFLCVVCRKSLLNAKFAVRNQQSLCSKECIQAFINQPLATAL